jgi:putative transposase
MPRGPRLDCPGALHHFIARGIERRNIFHNDEDRTDLLARIDTLVSQSRTRVYAWCLMPNHIHLLIRTGDPSLSSFAQRLLGGYAGAFNRRHHRSGHLFQNRFKSIIVDEAAYFLELVRYIHCNPVRAKLLPDLGALDRYPWTGHAALLGRHSCSWLDADEVLRRFGRKVGPARRRYRQFVSEALGSTPRVDLSGGGLRRSAGGWQQLCTLKRGRERWAYDERVLGDGEFVQHVLESAQRPFGPRRPLSSRAVRRVLREVAAAHDLDPAEITAPLKRRAVVRARREFCRRAVVELNCSLHALSVHVGLSHTCVQQAFHTRPSR